ncbi:MAG: hypothetical protein ACI9MC_003760 [Kiritimatiellia bacterium]|jgi:hypothetical protein
MKSARVLWLPLVLGLGGLVACDGGAPAKCDQAACAGICDGRPAPQTGAAVDPSTAGLALTGFEEGMLKTVVEDVRQGVRPMDGQSLGICPKGEGRECPNMLGMVPGELAEGDYILYGSFAVPNVGDKGTWKIRLDTECITTRKTDNGESSNTTQYSKEYDVVFAGKDRGYTLSPLRRITSPGKNGAQACTFKMVAPHGDGDKVYEGSWSVPDGS